MFVIGRKLSNTKGMVTLGRANRAPTLPTGDDDDRDNKHEPRGGVVHYEKGWQWVVGFYRSIDACARLADSSQNTVDAVYSHCMYYYYYVIPAGETEFTWGWQEGS